MNVASYLDFRAHLMSFAVFDFVLGDSFAHHLHTRFLFFPRFCSAMFLCVAYDDFLSLSIVIVGREYYVCD